jgi:bifunctional UDP-N-acetylglucosamine pyrophosphorylase/glucosamine-1-phosphate N-acetyltransferase/UDP-N-acetylglucosamine pyrophosphorylase
MESDLPKVLVPACGRPLVEYVLDAINAAGVQNIIVVVGYKAELVREALKDHSNVQFVEQTEQLGTGHAVQVCMEHLENFDGAVMVLTGDSPLTQTDSLKQLLDLYQSDNPACVMGTLKKDDPAGMGRIVRDDKGEFVAIVEHKDATEEQLKIDEVNMSTYLFDCKKLVPALGKLQNNNKQQEFYITDCPGILKEEGEDVRALPVLKPCEALSINNLADLSAVEEEMRKAT